MGAFFHDWPFGLVHGIYREYSRNLRDRVFTSCSHINSVPSIGPSMLVFQHLYHELRRPEHELLVRPRKRE